MSKNISRRSFVGAGSLAALTAALAACGGSSDSGSGDAASGEPKELNVFSSIAPAVLDPQNDSNSDDDEIFLPLGEGLFRYDSDGTSLVNGVCESYAASDDGLTYTFTLGESKWSDGSNVVAGDFAYAAQRLFDPATASENAYGYLSYIKGAAEFYGGEGSADGLGVVAKDDKTLEVTLASVLPENVVKGLFATSAFFPENQKAIEEGGDGWSTDPEHHLSNGPYKLSEFNPDESVVIVHNDAYVGNASAVPDTITYHLYADASAANAAMSNGELDYYKYAPTDLIAQIGDKADLVNSETIGTASLHFNWNCKPLDDVRVRQAIFLAIDAGYVNSILEDGNAVESTGLLGEKYPDPAGGSFRTADNALIEPYSDAALEQAKQLLADAGYPNGEGMPKLVYLTSNSTRGTARGEFFQALLKDQLGIPVEVGAYDIPTYLSMLSGSDWAFSYIAVAPTVPNPLETLASYITDAAQYGISIPEYDELYAQVTAEPDAQKQSELMHQMEEILIKEQFAFRPVLDTYNLTLYGKDTTDRATNPIGNALHNYLSKTSW